MNKVEIGVLSTGVYIPSHWMTSEEIAKVSDIPLEIIEKKMGIRKKPIPGMKDHTCQMGIYAAKEAIAKARVNPEQIDLVIYIGEEHKEYPLWTAGIKLQQEVGAVNAWAFDVAQRCGTTIMALKVAKSMMIADTSIQTVLLAGGYRNVDFIDYTNPRTRFMYNLSAGGGAILLKKGYANNQLLESHIMTDGTFSEDVVVVAGGTKMPTSVFTIEAGHHQLDVLDPEGMKQRLEEKSLVNFIKVVDMALQKSGYDREDINYLAILHMKKSAHDYMLKELGLIEDQTIYLQDYGHMGQFDQILSLQLALEQGKVKNGDIVVLVSAGIGYAWGASVIKWGSEKEDI
ncbi:3-oxoacyl-ACP synthase [Bacillus alkalisoli]|uniref:3-oxoacyl-ACP synthase n=1 Tax=Bacillus alkalisoli TaxID=2011008 RepID=UPI000C23743E|nr:3-oxoacyl-ACP synthase [Bacillus alkalisoli]